MIGDPPTALRIQLTLDPPPNPHNREDEVYTTHPILLLHLTLPPDYPSIAPEFDISFDPTSPISDALSLPDDKPALVAAVAEVAEENLGMQMIFSLAQTLKEAAELLIEERASAEQAEVDAEKEREEQKEMEKFRGELVTKERYLEWHAKLVREREDEKRRQVEKEEEEAKKRGATVAKEKKLTGRQLFERGIAGAGEEVDGEEADEEQGEGWKGKE